MMPYAISPGMDVGITGGDYAWPVRQCKVKADWQLNFRISFAGRLTKCPRPSFEYRGKPAYSYALAGTHAVHRRWEVTWWSDNCR